METKQAIEHAQQQADKNLSKIAKVKTNKYEIGYNLLMDYWDSIDEEGDRPRCPACNWRTYVKMKTDLGIGNCEVDL